MATKENHPGTVAVIDIGSNEIRLRIAQDNKGNMKFLESIAYPLNLGRDTFNMGMVSYEKVHNASEIIKNFLTVSESYGVTNIRAIATTAIREASNRDYILDQIKIKTGVDIQVIDENLEKIYIFKLISHIIDDKFKESAILAYTGSGSVGIAYMDNSIIPFFDNIKIGSLRVSELFDRIHEYSGEFYVVVEEYLHTFMNFLNVAPPESIVHFIASGIEISTIADLCGASFDGLFYSIDRERFLNLYDEIKFKSIDKLKKEYRLEDEKADVLLPAMCIYKNLMQLTKAKSIISPLVYLTEAVAFEMLYESKFNKLNKEFYNHTLTSARHLAKKYNIQKAHYTAVDNYAVKIFDKMKKIHGMGRRHKLLLQAACILHDCGKYISLKAHYHHSYNIIKGSDIVGLSKDEIDTIANISLYHSRILPDNNQENYKALEPAKKVLVSKLAAILRIADALDRSQIEKFRDIEVKLTDTELIVTVISDKNTELEEWAFKDKGVFFEEVFGLVPVIKKRNPR